MAPAEKSGAELVSNGRISLAGKAVESKLGICWVLIMVVVIDSCHLHSVWKWEQIPRYKNVIANN